MCDQIQIPENIRPLYLPSAFRCPPVKGMILHTDDEGKESICYPDEVWNEFPDAEMSFRRAEKNRTKRHYRVDLAKYKKAVKVALLNNDMPPPPPVAPTRKHMEGDKFIPRFNIGTSEGYWEIVPRGLTEEDEEEFMDKAWRQFENEQTQREHALQKWMTKNNLNFHTQSMAMKV